MNSKPMQMPVCKDPRVNFIQQTLKPNGTLPWQSEWGQVPKNLQGKVHRFARYITEKNFRRYRDRDENLTFRRLLEQTTRGYMGEIAFYCIYGVFNHFMAPDWFQTSEEYWPMMRVDWSPDHSVPTPFGFTDGTVGFEDKTGREFDPGWAIQWSSNNRRSRASANRMPLAYGAVGPNYFLVLMEHKHDNGRHFYRVAAITRGIDVYNQRNFQYKGVPLIGPMANGNQNKQQLTKEVLYNSGMTFYRPAWVQGPMVAKPTFTQQDFPVMTSNKKRKSCLKKKGKPSKRRRVSFARNDKIHIIENCVCQRDLEDGKTVDGLFQYLKKFRDSKMTKLHTNAFAKEHWLLFLENDNRGLLNENLRRLVGINDEMPKYMYHAEERSVINWETMFKRMRASVNW